MRFGHDLALWPVAAVIAGHLPAQPVKSVRDNVGCARCRVDIVAHARLPITDQTGPVDVRVRVAVRRDGGFIVAPTGGGSALAAFDGRGRIAKIVGKVGQGPGEFQGITRAIVTVGDSVRVFDGGNRRETVFSPTLTFVRSRTLGLMPTDARFLAGGRLLVNAEVMTQDRAGLPLHIIGLNGDIERSFGSTEADLLPGRTPSSIRRLGSIDGGTVWLSHLVRYRAERWSLDGKLLEVVQRETKWFPSDAARATNDPLAIRPEPVLLGTWIDSARTLWTASLVADERWRPRRPKGGGREVGPPDIAERDEIYDTVVEAIDPASGILLASLRVPEAALLLDAPGWIATYKTESGGERLVLWRVRLVR